ncbi:MAG: hypothetical protein OXE99_07255 [Cellvibrionales bacterium]|nr:hypothetical protein [Cellvibrionales bacterium]
MKFRNNALLLIIFMMLSCLSYSADILPSTMREKVYIFFSNEEDMAGKNYIQERKDQKYLVTYSADEYFMMHLGTDNLHQGGYEYFLKTGYHGLPWGIISHNINVDDKGEVFYLLMVPHDSMSGVYLAVGYSKPECDKEDGMDINSRLNLPSPEEIMAMTGSEARCPETSGPETVVPETKLCPSKKGIYEKKKKNYYMHSGTYKRLF